MFMGVGRVLFAALGLGVALAAAGWAWIGWKAGEELRRELAPPAPVQGFHRAVDCEGLPRERRMVVLVLGQSNSANHVESRAEGGPGVYTWHAGRCYEASDPLPGASGGGGSLWTRLGPMLRAQDAARAVLFVPLGITSTSIAQWNRHPVLVERLRSTAAALGQAGLAPTHVVWYQGEADSFKGTPGDAYRRDFARLLRTLREWGIDAPVYVPLATLCQTRSNPAVREVQAALPSEFAGVNPGPDMDALFGPGHRYDGCHFGAASAAWAAEAWLRALLGRSTP